MAGGAVNSEDISVLIIEEIAVAVFADIEEPLGATHGIIETHVRHIVGRTGRQEFLFAII